MSRYNGLMIGKVLRVDSDEGEPRIRILLEWQSEDGIEETASIAVPFAGTNYGQYFMPEEQTEVVIGFDKGNRHEPIILGYLWNQQQQSPEENPQNRIILTPGGHCLRFEDEAGKIILKSSGNHLITIDDDGIRIETDGGLSIKLNERASSIELSGGGRSLTLADSKVKIQ